MAEFILKDWHSKEKTFDHETIYVRGTDGELMPFTHGTGNPVLEELEVTENGSYTPSEGVDGFGSVKVNVPDIPAVVQPLEVTENGEYAVPDGVDGFNSVKVAVPIPEPILESLEITENGTYTAPDGVDGFSSVTVNVGAAKIAVLAEHEMTGFAPDSTWGYSTLDQAPSYTINEGEQYYVKWDGETYPVMLTDGSAAVAGATYLGNGSAFNLPGNGEPFAIVFVGGMILYTAMNDPKESHTVGIYKDAGEEIILQDKTITENGTYTADDGFAGLGKVIVDVASSGVNLKSTGGAVNLTSTSAQRVDFDFGFKPDVLLVMTQSFTHGTSGTTNFMFYGTSRRFANYFDVGTTVNHLRYMASSKKIDMESASYAIDEYNAYAVIYNADETGFNIGSHARGYYTIIAIGLGD